MLFTLPILIPLGLILFHLFRASGGLALTQLVADWLVLVALTFAFWAIFGGWIGSL